MVAEQAGVCSQCSCSVAASRRLIISAVFRNIDFFPPSFFFLKFPVYTPKSQERQRYFQMISLRSDGTQPSSPQRAHLPLNPSSAGGGVHSLTESQQGQGRTGSLPRVCLEKPWDEVSVAGHYCLGSLFCYIFKIPVAAYVIKRFRLGK